MKANDTQIGGSHYKRHTFETWDVIHDWGLGYFDGNAVKYLSRWREKGGVNDLLKARHYIDKLIEIENAQQKPDLLRQGTFGANQGTPMRGL